MSELKTKPTKVSPAKFVAALASAEARRDCRTLMKLLAGVTGQRPKMWGPSIIGYGSYHYKYESGHEGDMPVIGFAPRSRELVLYLAGLKSYEKDLAKLGKHRKGTGCLYLKGLAGVDVAALEKVLAKSVAVMRARYPGR